jgi:adenylate cyclase
MDWESEGLLNDLEGEARDARARLLEALYADGVPVEELRAAVAEDRLVLVPLERALMALPNYTLAEVAERSGVPAEDAELRLRNLGVNIPDDPDVRAFGRDEVRAVRRLKDYLASGIDLSDGQQIMHVFSGAMNRVAEPMRQLFAAKYLQPGDSEEDLALRFGERAEELMPLILGDLEFLLRMHLRDFARHDAVSASEMLTGALPESVDMAVAFADIVGFTALGEEITEVSLTDIAEQLERLAAEHVRRPARVVKAIGDAVLVVGREPAGMIDAMLDLVEAADSVEGMPPLRAGIAYGRAVPRLGDWYGPTVNLAARLADRARPGSVLTNNSVREALGDAAENYTFSEAGLKRFKGINDAVPTLRVRRQDPT